MFSKNRFGLVGPLLLTSALCTAITPALAAPVGNPTTFSLQYSGTSVPTGTAPTGGDSVTTAEIDSAITSGEGDSGDGSDSLGPQPVVNRTIAKGHAGGTSAANAGRAKSNPQLKRTFEGVNFHDQRFSNGGNQFSVEPPDQALCAGNGFVLQSVNDVLAIYDRSGNRLTGPVDLNSFYGYPAAINRTNGNKRGPSITDPVCYFDTDTQRWFHVVLTLDHVGTSVSLSGTNHLDIAVSQTADPRGTWNVYNLPVQNNGTQGTPNHQCAGGFCLGDYPHIGADANAIFLTTNEFALFGSGFYGAQIYAISKRALASGGTAPNVVLFNGGDPSVPAPAFTVWPAQSPNAQYAPDANGTEYLLSSDAVFNDSGTSSQIFKWAVTNTSAIDMAPASLALSVSPVPVQQYAVPSSRIVQKAGNTPLRDCVADPTCAPLIGSLTRAFPTPRKIAVNDSRMQQVSYANGKLWGALDTDVLQGTAHGSGIAYFVLNPNSNGLFANGTLSLPDASLTYPALAVTESGRGVIAFSVIGPNDYPSAGYAGLDAHIGAGTVHIAAPGVGPWDGFTGIPTFSNRARWGDYGAAAVDGQSIWIASEYIGQTCTYADYRTAPFGQCNGTRGSLSNWGTRISLITP